MIEFHGCPLNGATRSELHNISIGLLVLSEENHGLPQPVFFLLLGIVHWQINLLFDDL